MSGSAAVRKRCAAVCSVPAPRCLAGLARAAAPPRRSRRSTGASRCTATTRRRSARWSATSGYSDDWDLSQWWNILSLEIEANVAPDGIGPFDVISIFGRIEVRYDCVWTGGCSMFDSANAYAFSRFGKLPKRLMDARRTGYQGTNYIGDIRHFYDIPFDQVASAPDDRRLRPDGSREPMEFWQTPLGRGFFSALSYGADGLPQTADDLGFFYFGELTRGDCQRWGARTRPGSVNGRSAGETLLLDPNCDYESIGANAGTARTRSTRATSTR